MKYRVTIIKPLKNSGNKKLREYLYRNFFVFFYLDVLNGFENTFFKDVVYIF